MAAVARAQAAPEIPADKFSAFSKRLRPICRILELAGYYVWCNAPIESLDGKTHVFFSRWPAAKGMGIPDNSILRYETALKAGKFVLIAHGTLEDANRAKDILGRGKPDSLDHHQ